MLEIPRALRGGWNRAPPFHSSFAHKMGCYADLQGSNSLPHFHLQRIGRGSPFTLWNQGFKWFNSKSICSHLNPSHPWLGGGRTGGRPRLQRDPRPSGPGGRAPAASLRRGWPLSRRRWPDTGVAAWLRWPFAWLARLGRPELELLHF